MRRGRLGAHGVGPALRPELAGRITLTVVDNSRNLGLEPLPGVTVLPNRNLGGTGGFVRGLLQLIDGGEASHATRLNALWLLQARVRQGKLGLALATRPPVGVRRPHWQVHHRAAR